MNGRILTASSGEAKIFCSRLILMRKSVCYFAVSRFFEVLQWEVNTRIVLVCSAYRYSVMVTTLTADPMDFKMKKIIVVAGLIVSTWVVMQATQARAEVTSASSSVMHHRHCLMRSCRHRVTVMYGCQVIGIGVVANTVGMRVIG